MSIKTTVLAISTIYGFTAFPSSIHVTSHHRESRIAYSASLLQDTLPALHTFKDKDIASIAPSFEHQSLTVTLTNGNTYTYEHKDWDFEDSYPSLNKKIAEAIKNMQMTFTKVEHPPEFPGGEEAWDKYIHDFCTQNQKAIKKDGPAKITIQFIVHLKGQVANIQVLSNPDDSKLSALAMQAIQDGPRWIPAVQNGHTVVCYKAQVVTLSL